MLKEFNRYIEKEKLFTKKDKILLAVSGGIDSVVICRLFHQAGYSFAIAHCNFQLRGTESDSDESFAETLAEKYKVRFHSVSFNTSAFAKENGLSIQAAARKLRYDWFEEIREQFGYKFIATAHHSDDSVETFLINLIRGTGISGLHGILPKQGKILRPLLGFSKEQIRAFTKRNKLKFREDSSNASDKYLRNRVRHQLIPLLEEMNPSIRKTILAEIRHLSDAEKIYKDALRKKLKTLIRKERDGFRISIPLLVNAPERSAILFEALQPLGFHSAAISDIVASLDRGPGKRFFSETHRVIRDREHLIVEAVRKIQDSNVKVAKTQKEVLLNDCRIKFSVADANKHVLKKSKTVASLDMDKLKFPLEFRHWKEGDLFQPFGMNGKKKLSDFFIDEKLSLSRKEKIWLLCSGDKIVWVAGMRIDDRFRVSGDTKKIFVAELV
jgi:tRNA(Ile)-lysidine synthase